MTGGLALILPTDLPRRLAPTLLGVGNIGAGVAGLLDRHVIVASYARLPHPLAAWWIAGVAIGVVILVGMRSVSWAFVTAITAFTYWLLIAVFVAEAVHGRGPQLPHGHVPSVSWRAVWLTIWIALLQVLAMPYRRRRT